jgi:hypothetical protein
MGGHEITLTTATSSTGKGRLHPLRWLAKLLLQICGRPEDDSGALEHACRGPSFLHNLLPILEPFFTLNPKLLFIEDHILGRQQAPHAGTSFTVPASLADLRSQVEKASSSCDCDECAPWLYHLAKGSGHGKIQHQNCERKARALRFSYARNNPAPHPELRRRLYGEYEAMRLVRHHVAWLDQTYLRSPTSDNLEVLRLNSLLSAWNPHLAGADMRQTMGTTQLLQLMAQLNQVFFFGAVPPHQQMVSAGFSWLPESKRDCFGIGSFNPLIGTQILLHPTLYRHHGSSEDLDVRWRSRIGTILHEMCHAFLKAYTCRSCPMHDACIGPRGHGRAWQILAAKIEVVATRLMDGFVDMGRYPSLLHDLQGNGKLPSRHDLQVYRL